MESLYNAVPLPTWATVAGALALFVLVVVLVRRATFRGFLGTLPKIVLLALIGVGAYFGLRYYEDSTRRQTERRALDERFAILFTQTIQPGSVFACIDGSPQPAMLEACERTVFAEPQRVAAAVAIVSQRISFIADALRYSTAHEASYLDRIESLRNAVEADHYGFVAYVLSTEDKCTSEHCGRFALLRDATRVKDNMRVRRFEAFMVKHASGWREQPQSTTGDARAPALLGEGAVVPGVAIGERTTEIEVIEPGRPGRFGTMPKGNSPPPPPSAGNASSTPAENAAPASAAKASPLPAGNASPTAGKTDPPPPSPFEPPPGRQPEPAPATSGRQTAPATPPSRPSDLPTQRQPSSVANTPGKQSAPTRPAKSSAAQRKQKEPVAGLPRVVPGDYLRDKEKEEPPSQASGSSGAPTSIAPPSQNLFVSPR